MTVGSCDLEALWPHCNEPNPIVQAANHCPDHGGAVHNLVKPLEVIREAISNAHDAAAKEISIRIDPESSEGHVIEITDDGEGMDQDGIQRFFDLGNSLKAENRIGEKGLGTKTYFRSKRTAVETQPLSGPRLRAVMDAPWKKLTENQMPTATIEELEPQPGETGTVVRIIGYDVDRPERHFSYDGLEDYIRWFTAAGSFKTKFADQTSLHGQIMNLHVAPRVFLTAQTTNGEHREGEIPGTHWFAVPNESPEVPGGSQLKRSDLYCRHFGPYHKSTIIDGKPVSVQLYGTVSGQEARRQVCRLRQGGTLKSRFGPWLCKDFVPFAKRVELVSTDDSYLHYHILINSQAFSLNADRNSLTNEDDPAVQWVLTEARAIIDAQIKPAAEQHYFSMRKQEEEDERLRKQRDELALRKSRFGALPELTNVPEGWPILKRPTSEAQVAILFAAILAHPEARTKLPYALSIGTYSSDSPTDMICLDAEGKLVLVELEYRLGNLFSHQHALDTFDYVVCWERDLEVGETRQVAGKNLTLSQDQNCWFVSWGPQKKMPVIVLQEAVAELVSQ